jgi:hypothetical protein
MIAAVPAPIAITNYVTNALQSQMRASGTPEKIFAI